MTINKVLYSSAKEDYQTPLWLFKILNRIFDFDLDPCTSEDNPLGTRYFFTEQTNGLVQSWDFARSVYINPPYNREIPKWLAKVSSNLQQNPAQIIVMLLPVRSDTEWFHQYIYNKPSCKEIIFLKGRLRFEHTPYPAPFPSMVVVFGGSPLFGDHFKIQSAKSVLRSASA